MALGLAALDAPIIGALVHALSFDKLRRAGVSGLAAPVVGLHPTLAQCLQDLGRSLLAPGVWAGVTGGPGEGSEGGPMASVGMLHQHSGCMLVGNVAQAWVLLHALASEPPSGLREEGAALASGACARAASLPVARPGAACAHLFRLAVTPSDAAAVAGQGAVEPGATGNEALGDLRTAAERVHDGRRWLGQLLHFWREVFL